MISSNGNPIIIDRRKVLVGLQKIRQEWEDATEGADLTKVQGSVGLLLQDITEVFGLSLEEKAFVLGFALIDKRLNN
ncbi:MAG: hypothetical protein GY796_05020 [Chloroflexi bacterium]|nr:hypothetical protein [Chloroflexota bacterium]